MYHQILPKNYCDIVNYTDLLITEIVVSKLTYSYYKLTLTSSIFKDTLITNFLFLMKSCEEKSWIISRVG